ncbi:hypothetical protein AGMMS50229_14050 [Campylobacterota bacterium]|nr:hypothetical protein AGMMS50229_14050 [Campylobacterota bacterium]
MRIITVFLLFFGVVFCAIDSAHYVLDRVGEKQELKIAVNEKWIAVNHTTDELGLTIDEKKQTITVWALKKKINGLIEVVLVDRDDSYFLSFELYDPNSPYKLFLHDKKPDGSSAIGGTNGKARIEESYLYYEGEKSGNFTISYTNKNDQTVSKLITISTRGLSATDTLLEIVSGESKRLIIDCSFSPQIEIVVEPENGEAFSDDQSIIYHAVIDGDDRLVFLLDNEPIILPIKVYERRSEIIIGTRKLQELIRRQNGLYQQFRVATSGELSMRFFTDDRIVFELISPAETTLTIRDDHSFWIHYKNSDFLIDKSLTIRGVSNKKQFVFKLAKKVIVNADGSVTAR